MPLPTPIFIGSTVGVTDIDFIITLTASFTNSHSRIGFPLPQTKTSFLFSFLALQIFIINAPRACDRFSSEWSAGPYIFGSIRLIKFMPYCLLYAQVWIQLAFLVIPYAKTDSCKEPSHHSSSRSSLVKWPGYVQFEIGFMNLLILYIRDSSIKFVDMRILS